MHSPLICQNGQRDHTAQEDAVFESPGLVLSPADSALLGAAASPMRDSPDAYRTPFGTPAVDVPSGSDEEELDILEGLKAEGRWPMQLSPVKCEDSEDDCDDSVDGYSMQNEVKYFFHKGIPLGVSAVLEWGVPPMFAQIMAGHTENSSELQSALGFGRVFYVVSTIMVVIGLMNYAFTVIPGCVGAGRIDRVAGYLQRSLLLSAVTMLPILALQFVASPIMSTIGVQTDIAHQVGVYCRLMTVSSCLLIVEFHLQAVFVSLGYARCAAFNSFVSGIAVDMLCAYFFIYRWGFGTAGAAYTQIAVKSARIAVWCGLIWWFDLHETICVNRTETILVKEEVAGFFRQAIPKILANFSGWFVFELQVVALANITDIPSEAVTAGAIWVQMESTLAAIQTGWQDSTTIRTLVLLGRQDSGAPKAFAILCSLSSLVTLLFNIPVLLCGGAIADVMSDDSEVREWFRKLVWVLALQAQTRIAMMTMSSLLIPIEKGVLNVVSTFVATYLIACPLSGMLVLTDLLGAHSIATRMMICMATSSMANVLVATFGLVYSLCMDWEQVSDVTSSRANSDRERTTSFANPDDSPKRMSSHGKSFIEEVSERMRTSTLSSPGRASRMSGLGHR